MKIKLTIIIIGFIWSSLCFSVQPVIDNSNLVEMANHLTELKKHYDLLNDQYLQLQKQYAAITGINDYSAIFELLDKNGNNFWSWSPDTENLDQMTTANQGNPNELLFKQIQHYNEIYGMSGDAELYVPHDPKSYSAQFQVQQALAARQGLSISDVAFDRTHHYDKEQLEKLEIQGYSLQNAKESMDYANTLQLELIKLFNDMMKLQARQLQLMSINETESSLHNDFNAKFFNTDFNKD